MAIMKRLAQIGIAKKIYDEARKPENQRKIKQAIGSLQNKAQQRGRGRKH